jgi:hypothetical protein
MTVAAALFNPRPRVERLTFDDGRFCLIVDDALLQPDRLRQYAVEHRSDFVHAGFNAYPGVEFPMPADISVQLDEFFMRNIRSQLGGRRNLKMNCRMAMVTTPPDELRPTQWICHRDSAWIDPRHTIAASVLYLFEDPALGGTSFYAPKLPPREVDLLVHDSSTMSSEQFAEKYRLTPGYIDGSNEYFERIGRVPAKWNRMIFYDGRIFHCSEVGSPRALSGDPMSGRLTLNGFFTCSRKAG